MRIHRSVRIVVPLLLAGLALAPAPSAAWPGDGPEPHVVRHRIRVRSVPVPLAPPVIVRGYLPRNPNVPMYNEPPRRGPAW